MKTLSTAEQRDYQWLYRQTKSGRRNCRTGNQRYRNSTKGKAAQKRGNKRYGNTTNGRAVLRKRDRRSARKLKQQVIDAYGGKCKKCGVSDIRVLSVDHPNGGGSAHRKRLRLFGNKFYYWLKRNSFPKGYQVLCMNCQWIKRYLNNECSRIKNAGIA